MKCIEFNGIGVALLYRVAHSAIRRSFEETGTRHETCPDIPIIAFIRDPFERFLSGAAFLQGRYTGCPTNQTYQGYVDNILSGGLDLHWLPQSAQLDGINDLTIYPYERINLVWDGLRKSHGFPQLTTYNVTDYALGKRRFNHTDTRYRLDELLDYYAEDYELRDKVWQK